MALFIISWMDKPGALPLRLATRQAHLDYVAAHPGVVRLAGPYLNERGEMAGSMIVIEAGSQAEAEAFHHGDPYRAAGLFAASSVTPWRATVGAIG